MVEDSGSDTVWKRDEIESPCVKVCVVHPQAKLCMGCYRTPQEIARWSRMTPEERRAIMDGLADRAPALREAGLARRRARRGERSEP